MGATASGNSYLSIFKRCRRKFYFRHVRRLVGKDRSPALDIGTLCHTALQVLPHAGLDKALLAMELQWKEEMEEDWEDNCQVLDLAVVLIKGYAQEYSNDPFTSIMDEFEFSFNISPYVYTGKIDRIVRGPDGNFYVMEHKTSGEVPSVHLRRFFNDPQITGYYIGAQQALKNLGGAKLAGVIVDGLYKPRAKKDGSYPPITEKNFVREVFTRSVEQVEEFLSNTEEVFKQISQAAGSIEAYYKCEGACFDFFRPCEYLDLCKFGIDERVINAKFDIEEVEDAAHST